MEKVVVVNPLQRARARRANIQAPQPIPEQPHQEEPRVQIPTQESFNWEWMQGSINQMQGNINQIIEQQEHFNWDQMQESLNQIMEQQMVEQRNLAEFRALFEARSIQRGQYNVNTQAKLNYLCSTIAALKPNTLTFEQGMETLRVHQEEIIEKHKEDERGFIGGLAFGNQQRIKDKKEFQVGRLMTTLPRMLHPKGKHIYNDLEQKHDKQKWLSPIKEHLVYLIVSLIYI
ncbi:hypothetical protein AHAS_Ahas13G0321000 [Arachis hypogaea]